MTRRRSRSEDRMRPRRRHRSRESDSSKRRTERVRSRDGGVQRLYEKIGRQKEGDREVWEYHNVTVTRVPNHGLGIAVSGGRDNAHFANGDHSIVISDVLKAGPAEGKLMINDRVITANGISLENVDYAHAVHVLRECGNKVNLVIKRRVVLPPTVSEAQTLRVTLRKSKKKDDFGIILGCRIYVKEITNESLLEKSGGVREGDVITQINKSSTETLTLKEAKKLMDSSREKLQLVVRREPRKDEDYGRLSRSVSDPFYIQNKDRSSPSKFIDVSTNRMHWSNQNVYVPSPTRGTYIPSLDRNEDKNNLYRPSEGMTRRGLEMRSPEHFQQLTSNQLPNIYPRLVGNMEERDRPPRPPLPSMNEFGARRETQPEETSRSTTFSPPDIRYISYHKDGSMGFRLTGGNEVGVFVSAVHAGSAPHLQGLQQGDKILKVNDTEAKGLTREDVIMLLLSGQNQVNLAVRHCKEEFEEIVASGKKDSFYIRTHFSYESSAKGELNFLKGEVFHAVDTLYNDAVGSWLVYRVGNNGQDIQKGVIPNRTRAEEYCQIQETQVNKGKIDSRGSFFKRRARRYKSVNKINWEDIVFGDGDMKFPAYEEVKLKHPGFLRPVVLFGPLADVAKSKLLEECPNRFESPKVDSWVDVIPKAQKSFGIFRLRAIRDIIDKDKHAVLDIPPSALDRLHYTQMYPIVIFLRAENKNVVKELRDQYAKANFRDTRKLYDHAVKLEKLWFHAFSAVVPLTSTDSWYKKLQDTISKQQQQKIWMCEKKPPNNAVSDDFLFPVSPRLNCITSSESDREPTTGSPILDPQGDGSPIKDRRLVRSSSDPSLAFNKNLLTGPIYQTGFSPSFDRSEQRLMNAPNVYNPDSRKYFTLSGNSEEIHFQPRDPTSPLFGQRVPQELSTHSRYPMQTLTSFSANTNAYPPAPPVHRPGDSRPPPPPRNLSLPRRGWMPQSEPTLNSLSKEKGARVQIDLLRYDRSNANNTFSQFPYYSSSYPKEGAMFPKPSILKNNPYVSQSVVDNPQYLDYREEDRTVAGANYRFDRYYPAQKVYGETNQPVLNANVNEAFDPDEPPSTLPPPPPPPPSAHLEKSEQHSNAFNHHEDSTFPSPDDINMDPSAQPTPEDEEPEYNVIDTVRGVFDSTGGVLTSKKTGVRLTVPPGAIYGDEPQEIYFKVCHDTNMLPSLDEQTGEALMSPLVMCGPHGLQFKVPVELHLPHCASVGPDGWTLSSKSTNVDTGETKELESGTESANFITVPVDHF